MINSTSAEKSRHPGTSPGGSEKPAGPRHAPPEGAWAAPSFVWGIWGAMLLADLDLVRRFHMTVPHGEDWGWFVPYVAGTVPLTLEELWSPVCEHRQFLMKLLGWALLRLGHGDYCAVNLFMTLTLGGMAVAMIRAARHLRGRTTYSDAFFALALLQWPFTARTGYSIPFLLYGVPLIPAGVVLVIMVRQGVRLTPGTAVVAGVCLLLVPLCGATGMLYLPALVLWFGCAAWYAWRFRGPRGRSTGLIILLLLTATLGLVGLYFHGLEVANNITRPGHEFWGVVLTALALLTQSFGPVAASWWPYSGPPLLLLLVLSAAGLGVEIWYRLRLHDSRGLALLFFLGAITTLALGLGWGRGALGPGYAFSYAMMPGLALPCVYFIWEIARPRALRPLVQMCLFALLCAVVALNVRSGLERLNDDHEAVKAFEQDVKDGKPPYELVARHYGIFGNPQPFAQFNYYMEILRDAGVEPYRSMASDPPFTEQPLSLTPIELHEVTWTAPTAHVTGAQPYLTLALPAPTFVAGVRIRGKGSSVWNSPGMEWRRSGETGFVGRCSITIDDGHPPFSVTWIAETIDHIRLYLDTSEDAPSFDYRIDEITLLVP